MHRAPPSVPRAFFFFRSPPVRSSCPPSRARCRRPFFYFLLRPLPPRGLGMRRARVSRFFIIFSSKISDSFVRQPEDPVKRSYYGIAETSEQNIENALKRYSPRFFSLLFSTCTNARLFVSSIDVVRGRSTFVINDRSQK